MKEQKIKNVGTETTDDMTVETFVTSPENAEVTAMETTASTPENAEAPTAETPVTAPETPVTSPADAIAATEAAEVKAVEKLSKEDKFKKLAEARTTKILLMLESLSKLSSAAYKSTPEQVDAMFSAIGEAVNEAYAKYQPKQKTGKEGKAFKF